MSATAVAIGSVVVTAIIALIVPGLAFRWALRQDHDRWLREQRSARPEVREQAAEVFAAGDVRLPPLERARLGARGTIFGSQAVNKLFNELQSVGTQETFSQRDDDGLIARIRVGEVMDKLEAAVRHELGADRIRLRDPG